MYLSASLVFLILSILVSASPEDLPLALSDMQSKSYFDFVILLDMLNRTRKWSPYQEATFFMPTNKILGESGISREQLPKFILGHAIPQAIAYSELSHVPTGTLIPSFVNDRLLRVSSVGKQIFVNNAEIIAPDVCSSASIKCHGIDAVIVEGKE
ncbi:hypothetical protein ACHQM5_025539 [Ranunculus cassubicifolius]